MALNKYGWFLDGHPAGLLKPIGLPTLPLKLYFEYTVTHGYVSGFDAPTIGFGIAGSSAALNNAGQWDNNSSQAAEAQIVGNAVNTLGSGRGIGYPTRFAGIAVGGVNNVYACAILVNTGTRLAWFRNVTGAGSWIGGPSGGGVVGDPVAGTNGFDWTGVIVGRFYAWGGLTQRNNTNYGEGRMNFGGSAFSGTVPSGYVAWGAADTLNPSDKASVITLSSGNLTFSTSGAGDLSNTGRLVRSILSYPQP